MNLVSVPLANTGEVVVDADDVSLLAAHRWTRVKCGGKFYAACDNGTQKPQRLYMHRFLLGLQASSRPWVDHIDGDGLNNARANLRIASASLNAYNRPVASAYRNVYRQGVGFIARIGRAYAGYFPTEIQAAVAADELAARLYGDAARLNFSRDLGSSFLTRRFLEAA